MSLSNSLNIYFSEQLDEANRRNNHLRKENASTTAERDDGRRGLRKALEQNSALRDEISALEKGCTVMEKPVEVPMTPDGASLPTPKLELVKEEKKEEKKEDNEFYVLGSNEEMELLIDGLVSLGKLNHMHLDVIADMLGLEPEPSDKVLSCKLKSEGILAFLRDKESCANGNG